MASTQRQIDLTFDLSYPVEHAQFLQRLGEIMPTEINVQVFNNGVPYNIASHVLGFEMRDQYDKIVIDTDQTRFTKVSTTQGIFTYRPPSEVQSFFGNAYLAYFTFESGEERITTERFRFYNDEDVQLAVAPELREHYVSVIDDLVSSNGAAMAKAEEIKNLIETNQVVKKSEAFYDYAQPNGDTINISGQDLNTIQKTGLYGGNNLGNSPDGTTAFFYVEVVRYSDRNYVKQHATFLAGTRSFAWTRKMTGANAWSAWDRNALTDDVVKKAGDTVTGAMTFLNTTFLKHNVEHTLADGKKGVISVINDSNSKWALAPIMNSTADWTKEVAIDLNTGKLTVADFATKKDGTANLTLTSDATNANVGYMPIADRRGNTVTVRMEVTRNVESTSSLICTLPTGYRPVNLISMHFLANDGSIVSVNITTDGKIEMFSVGKRTKIVATFVAA